MISSFTRNKIALTTLCFFAIIVLLALLAYMIIPDGSQNANRQIPQLALSQPFSTHSVCQSVKQQIKQTTILSKLLYGYEDNNIYYPCDSMIYAVGISSMHYKNSVMDRPGEYKRTEVNYLLGSDKYGRDVLSRIILGLRVSLIIGFLAVLVSVTIGVVIGSIGGYYGGWIDQLVMIIINTSWSIPTLLLAFAIIIALGKGFIVIVLAVGLTMWVDVARIVRGLSKEEKEKSYVAGGKVMGLSDLRIIARHILPNIIGPILVMAAANFATAILVEAGLSYLGLGIQPPAPSLGNMLKENYAYATGGYVYLAICPIITIMLLVLNFNLLGTALRDVFDVKSKKS